MPTKPTNDSNPVSTALVALVLEAHGLRTEHAALALLRLEPSELFRLSLEAYRKNEAAFENLPMGLHDNLTTEQSLSVRLALKLGSFQALPAFSLTPSIAMPKKKAR